jgi:ATP-dependent protease Clp ATPase subunit
VSDQRTGENPPNRPLGLFPASPADALALFDLLREVMGLHIVGQEEEIDRLALLGVRHLSRDLVPPARPLRGLLLGPRSSGKSTLLGTFVAALGMPHVTVPAEALAETNWSGADIGDFLGQLYDQDTMHPDESGLPELAERAVVVVDGFDALRLPGRYGSASTKDYQRGRQQGLVPLMTGGVIPIERYQRSLYWPSRRALVIACGSFEGLRSGLPSTEDLIDWGIIPALANSLASSTVVRLNAASRAHLPRILARNLEGATQAFRVFGYTLTVSPEALGFVADRILTSPEDTGVGAAIGWITDAADRALAGMIRGRVPEGTHRVLAPDDILVSGPPRGLWRE